MSVENSGGLLSEDNQRLNSLQFVLDLLPEERFAELTAFREKYFGDPKALEMIDGYDTQSEFGKQRTAYLEALRAGDESKVAIIEKEAKEKNLYS